VSGPEGKWCVGESPGGALNIEHRERGFGRVFVAFNVVDRGTAERIVRAVNALPALVEALEEMLAGRGPCHPAHSGGGFAANCVRCRARAALLSAREGK